MDRRSLLQSLCKIAGKRLPAEYMRLEYIESTGTQWINSGIIPNGNHKYIAELSFVGTTTNQQISGGTFGETGRISFGRDNGFVYFGFKNENITTSIIPDISKHTFTLDLPNNTYAYDNTTFMGSNRSFQNMYALSLCILCRNGNGGVDAFLEAKLYSFTLYENNILIRNFIPALRLSDMKPGLYDMVNDQFYINQGTGEFKYKILPDEYQQVEYIQSTGTQWIDTGVSGGNSGGYEISFLPTALISSYQQYFAGTMSTQGQVSKLHANSQVNSLRIQGSSSSLLINVSSFVVVENTEQGIASVNGTVVGSFTNQGGFGELPYYVFNSNEESNLPSAMRLRYLRMRKDNALVRNFIPCYRKSDNEIGLYDLVTETFFTNQGTGSFIKGPDV